jgi:ribosomal protein L29
MSNLPWEERVALLSVHPDAASRDDVARLAAELMEMHAKLTPLRAQHDAYFDIENGERIRLVRRAVAAEARCARLTEAINAVKKWFEESDMTYWVKDGVRHENELYELLRSSLSAPDAQTAEMRNVQ